MKEVNDKGYFSFKYISIELNDHISVVGAMGAVWTVKDHKYCQLIGSQGS